MRAFSSSNPAAAFAKTFDSSSDFGDKTTITRAVTMPALSYSLNIANTNSTTGLVLARPTLAAIEGLAPEFFSGSNMKAAVISRASLGEVSMIPTDKRFGVKLAVTPKFLGNNRIQLRVVAERTVLSPVVQPPCLRSLWRRL